MNDVIIERAMESGGFFLFAMVELTVLFIVISFVVGCINEFIPQDKVKRLLSGRRGRGYFIGAMLGGLTPFCSCSSIPMMAGLLKAGAGFGPTMSFLFASPLVNPVLLGLFFTLLGPKVTIVYSVLALGFAVISGITLEKLGFSAHLKGDVLGVEGKEREECGCASPPVQPLQSIITSEKGSILINEPVNSACCPSGPADEKVAESRWKRIGRESIQQFRKFFPFMVLGVAIGALIHGFLPAEFVTQVAGEDNFAAIPVSAIIGIPLYIRASTMLPIASSLLLKGMSMGSVIALIIGGAGASLPEVAMLKGMFKTKLLLAFLFSVFFAAVSSGIIMNLIF